MTLKQIAGISFAAMMMVAANASAGDMKVVKNGDGVVVKNSFGECVQAQYGFDPEGCEAAPPAPAAAPVATPRTAVPAPRAPVVPKVKAKGHYKGKVQMDPASRATMQGYQK
jgi:OOP family OmpA-OmpF porin